MPLVPILPASLLLPTRLDLLQIELAMLYPSQKDTERRLSTYLDVYASVVPDMIQDGSIDPSTMTKKALADLFKAVNESTALEVVQKKLSAKFEEGKAVGGAICELLRPDFARATKWKDAQAIAMGALKSTFGPKSFERIWTEYRPAAHWWAAFQHRVDWGHNSVFPCAVEDLPRLIGWADYFLDRGAQFQMGGGARRTLLDPATAWRVSEEVIAALPPDLAEKVS